MDKYQHTYKVRNSLLIALVAAILILLLATIYRYRNEEVFILGAIAIVIGFLGILNKHIEQLLFKPRIELKIALLPTITSEGLEQRFFNLLIKNSGSLAKNIRLKIRDSKDKEWVNLKRPFGDQLEDGLTIRKLSKGEEGCFNICCFDNDSEICRLNPNIMPNNQNFIINKGNKEYYYLEVIGDNLMPVDLKIEIENNDFENGFVKIIYCKKTY